MNTRISINADSQAIRTLVLPLQVHMATVAEYIFHLLPALSQNGLFRTLTYAPMKLGSCLALIKIGPTVLHGFPATFSAGWLIVLLVVAESRKG